MKKPPGLMFFLLAAALGCGFLIGDRRRGPAAPPPRRPADPGAVVGFRISIPGAGGSPRSTVPLTVRPSDPVGSDRLWVVYVTTADGTTGYACEAPPAP